MITMKECTRNNLCVDCDNAECWHHGHAEADCPLYKCKFPEYYDNCSECQFLQRFQDEMRKEYQKNE